MTNTVCCLVIMNFNLESAVSVKSLVDGCVDGVYKCPEMLQRVFKRKYGVSL